MFVLSINPETNTVVIGTKEELERQTMWVRDYNLVKYAKLPENYEALVKIRYKDAGTMATLTEEEGKIRVVFHKPVSGVAPGQSAVFYEGDDLVGGGFIDRKIDFPKFTEVKSASTLSAE
jgi:tRNA-specific 2-thiouridylase